MSAPSPERISEILNMLQSCLHEEGDSDRFWISRDDIDAIDGALREALRLKLLDMDQV